MQLGNASKNAHRIFTVVHEDVFASATMLQNAGALITAHIQRDPNAGKELRQLAGDLFSLLEVMAADEKELSK